LTKNSGHDFQSFKRENGQQIVDELLKDRMLLAFQMFRSFDALSTDIDPPPASTQSSSITPTATPPTQSPAKVNSNSRLGQPGPSPSKQDPSKGNPSSTGRPGLSSARPNWQDDNAVSMCNRCRVPFTFFNRKHHCRKCGLIFCNVCTSNRRKLPSYIAPQRVCIQCVIRLA